MLRLGPEDTECRSWRGMRVVHFIEHHILNHDSIDKTLSEAVSTVADETSRWHLKLALHWKKILLFYDDFSKKNTINSISITKALMLLPHAIWCLGKLFKQGAASEINMTDICSRQIIWDASQMKNNRCMKNSTFQINTDIKHH